MLPTVLNVLCLFLLAAAQKKSGDCPPLPDIGVCEINCFSDAHCAGPFKCCPTACGGTFCTPSVTTRQVQRAEKAGSCPSRASGPWVCSSRCAYDVDCKGSKKCCRNRCGAMACIKPEF